MNNKAIKTLLVEQDPSACQFVKQALSDCSKTVKFDTKIAKNLSRATELLNRSSFDIILSDLQLPDSSGIDTVRKIRASNPHIPIIVMTELADEEIGLKAIKNGADDYLIKGKIFRDVLARSIRYAIERRKERTRTEKVLKEERNRAQNYLEEVKNINRELEDFAHVVSHDLKAPLRRIRTLAEWLATSYIDKLDQQGKEQINLLLKRVDRMRDLIDGILQYSKAGRSHEEGTQVNLNQLVPEIIEMIGPDENIEIEIENELPTILCRPTPITQVFQNLLSNAVKYMDKPRGQIKISCVEENGLWKFSIADNGPGVEEKNFEKIFRVFQTLSPQNEFESTGIGLSVVKKNIESYGGRIRVQSKPGEGSTFFFTLPKQQTEAQDTKFQDAVELPEMTAWAS